MGSISQPESPNQCSAPVFLRDLAERESVDPREHTGYLPHLGRMQNQLRQTSRQIETAVVGVCANFQAMAERAQSTVGKTTTFLHADENGSSGRRSFEGLIASCSSTLLKILEASDDAASISRRAIERIRQMDEASQQMARALDNLAQIARENRMLAFNAQIEAAHAGEQGAGFAVVAVEVAAQSDRAKEVTAEVSELVFGLRELASSAVKDLLGMTERKNTRLKESQDAAHEALSEMQTTHTELKQMLGGMCNESDLLAKDIGSAVRKLQFQDRVSQQLSHVIEDLEALRTQISEPGGGGADSSTPEFSSYTMHEERETAGIIGKESAEGDIELF